MVRLRREQMGKDERLGRASLDDRGLLVTLKALSRTTDSDGKFATESKRRNQPPNEFWPLMRTAL